MRKSLVFFFGCFLCITTAVVGKSTDVVKTPTKYNGVVYSGIKNPIREPLFVLSDTLKADAKDTIHHKKHRLVAALLSFPIIGIFGLHRLYLGSSGRVPFIYIVTVGGAFGVLPFIDFVMILLSKNKDFHTTYTGNNHLFMWQKTRK